MLTTDGPTYRDKTRIEEFSQTTHRTDDILDLRHITVRVSQTAPSKPLTMPVPFIAQDQETIVVVPGKLSVYIPRQGRCQLPNKQMSLLHYQLTAYCIGTRESLYPPMCDHNIPFTGRREVIVLLVEW